MNYIDIGKVNEAAKLLKGQIGVLSEVYEKIAANEEQVRRLSYTDSVQMQLQRAKAQLKEEIRLLRAFENCLKTAVAESLRAERKIMDHYERETMNYPKPAFGVSRICGMEAAEDLLRFGN